MTSSTAAQPIDERLEQLLDVERRLEASLREAERESLALVGAARARAEEEARAQAAALAARERAEDEAELATHRGVLAQIAAAAAERCARLADVDEPRVRRLAGQALRAVIDGAAELRP